MGVLLLTTGYENRDQQQEKEPENNLSEHAENVSQKLLTSTDCRITLNTWPTYSAPTSKLASSLHSPRVPYSEKYIRVGSPNPDLISTSYVERLNATTRLHMRRLTRLTLAFSKKRENFDAAVGLHFGFYNFVKRHSTLKTTPAVASGIAQRQFTVGELLEAIA